MHFPLFCIVAIHPQAQAFAGQHGAFDETVTFGDGASSSGDIPDVPGAWIQSLDYQLCKEIGNDFLGGR